MSDILIKGMEMPKNIGVSVTIYPDGRVIRYLGYGAKEQLGTAVPVPPHGRLIDADALHEELYALEYARENEWLDGVREARGVDAARVALLDAPTIIPATEVEEES